MATIQSNYRARRNFGRIEKILEVPNLIKIQKASYEKFLQSETVPRERESFGLQGVFQGVFPIKSFDESAELVFREYALEKPKYDVDECRQRGMTFAAPIKVTIELFTYEAPNANGERDVRDIKQQEVYFGEIPLMTDTGTFIINGTERVVVSQLHRSPGVFFDQDKGKTHSSGKNLFSARVIPYRGSWLDFEFDPKDIIYVRIDRRRKLHGTVLLRALGYTGEEILNYFYDTETIYLEKGNKLSKSVEFQILAGQRATADIKTPGSNEVLVKREAKFTKAAVKKLRDAKIDRIEIDPSGVLGRVVAQDVLDPETGEFILVVNETVTETKLELVRKAGIESLKVLFTEGNAGPYLRDTLVADRYDDPDGPMAALVRQYGHTVAAQIDIYRKLRPGDIPEPKEAAKLLDNLFFNAERYDLSKVGRLKLNYKFYKDRSPDKQVGLDKTVLTPEDILQTIKNLIEVKATNKGTDDIDHLGNRRVRAVGELLENQYRIGLVRMERAIKERMSVSPELDTLMPHDLINAKPVSAVVKEYFGSSQLSQFMDQTNPLSEVTHKRRLSALGPGGLTRERAGFEVRDVHATHYGRICPIETPEGPNIGLIASLSCFARVNEYGFVETPYRVVAEGIVTPTVNWYSALEEEGQYIAQATAVRDEKGRLTELLVSARFDGEYKLVSPEQITLIDISPFQLVSVAAALIPFLEHDDANRALMGANMQRQAVPLVRAEAPFVGTGLEAQLARDSGVCVLARRRGVVETADAARIVVRAEGKRGDEPDIYNVTKYQRSNQNTCWNQRPIVVPGEVVEVGDVLADGPATDTGDLALGQNILVAFMPWGGYNFEDSILINENLVANDIFTSVHIEEFECVARDTKLGREEITRDIPNVGEEALKDLDEAGIVRVGAEVKPNDILVGKITPKGETQLSPEEKLLRAIFGEKAGDVRDTSLRVPPGVTGIVINARVFARKTEVKDERAKEIEDYERAKLEKDRDDQVKIVRDGYMQRIRRFLLDKATVGKLEDDKGKVLLAKGTKLTEEILDSLPRSVLKTMPMNAEDSNILKEAFEELDGRVGVIEANCADKVDRLSKGDELPPGVIKMVKVYIAIKRKLQVGDKMAGRHGNKGVVSRIMAQEDMPYMPSGEPVHIVLNPLGVPSRMNVGQVLETHLGWAARELGIKLGEMVETGVSAEIIRKFAASIFSNDKVTKKLIESLDADGVREFARKLRRGVFTASPVFDGAPESEIKRWLEMAGLPSSGQSILFDGRTGEAFDQSVTVGVMYILKLHHLVDDKIHARSIGPYSLVTQQPLGGKAQFGGQRLGEMEVWAMEAYGAAYALQEFLTVKSDDVQGRTKMYEAIVKGDYTLEPGVPESFNVLVKELQALCLNVELLEDGVVRQSGEQPTAAE
ncbi:MAG: DNA-directed RNA polymerase subunit beta [Deltaproteobacteria bacterium]|nr:DNA-directed RNA polymerase subunit beta [Deltaproteobacteria bacterium]